MAFCPVCGYEYEKGIDECPDCDVQLVEELHPDYFEGEMVEVYSTFSASDAGMVKELLYNEGIFAAASNEMGSSMFGSAPSDAGEVRVYVADSDEDKARELIDAFIEDNPMEERDEFVICGNCGQKVDEGEEECPYCGVELE